MKRIMLLILFVNVVCQAFTQTVTPEERTKANEYFDAGNWPQVVISYQAIAKREPQNFNARMRAGIGLLNQTKTQAAITQLEEAVALGANPMPLYYLSTAYAQGNHIDKCFETLEKSLTNGFTALSLFETDANLSRVKSNPRYETLHQRLLRGVYPCRYADQSRQFDFWIGEWDVKAATGQPAGKSKIELLLGDCIIYENWTSAPPQNYAGKSFNLYNSGSGKWMQTWVDDKGAVIEFMDGEYKDNKMVFVTRPDKQNQVTRLTFFNLDKNNVRQLFEITSDAGKTWTTTTDLFYHRVQK